VAVRHDAGRLLDAERLDAVYVSEKQRAPLPVMLHRAIVGSLERFIGILIEQHAGALPVWLAPVQVAVASITDAHAEYAASVAKSLQNKELEPPTICATRNKL